MSGAEKHMGSVSELPPITSSITPNLYTKRARYDACRSLDAAGVQFCIWAEDAMAAYGIPTIVFGLYLMTDDVAAAADVLVRDGYTKKPLEHRATLIPEFSQRYRLPGFKDNRDVILLDTTEWNYNLAETTTTWLPPLNKFMDSLLCRWTDEGSLNLRFHLAVHVGYFFIYVREVKNVKFAAELQKENRQLFYDLIDGPASCFLTTLKCQEHYRMVREEIRRGDLDPVGQSDVCLFPGNLFFSKQ